MKGLFYFRWLAAAVLAVMFLSLGVPALAADKTIVGKVNDNYQIVAQGKIYEIDDTSEGRELAENHVGANVRVIGRVVESENMTIITVVSYKVLSE
jgi:hypothetical protein